MKKLFSLLILILVLSLTFTFVACDNNAGNGGEEVPEPPSVNVADFGVKTMEESTQDQAVNFQRAIDYAYENGIKVVKVNAGRYNVSFIQMREGIALDMASGYTQASKGYTQELANKVDSGEVTVLVGTQIMNNEWQGWGRNACSNITIRGGVLDNQKSSKGPLMFACGDNITLENFIIKDCSSGHAIQIAGCTNFNINNCMFVGFKYGDPSTQSAFWKEMIQIESTQPPAFGTAATAPQRFEQSERMGCENITIQNSYFGASDLLPAPHIAIGHHGYGTNANCKGLIIRNNVFNKCSYAGIRLPNVVDVEIYGNTFTADKSSNKLCTYTATEAQNPAFIIFFTYSTKISYTAPDGTSVTVRLKEEQSGTHNVDIHHNEFYVNEGSDKKIIFTSGTNYVPGSVIAENVSRQDAYDTPIYELSGYFRSTNYISNLTFRDNKVNYVGKPAVRNACMTFSRIYGVTFLNNQLNYESNLFNYNYENYNGVYFNDVKLNEEARTYVLNLSNSLDCYVKLSLANGTVSNLLPGVSGEYTIKATEGGRIEIDSDTQGNLIIKPVAEQGKTFRGWQDQYEMPFTPGEYGTMNINSVLYAVFE